MTTTARRLLLALVLATGLHCAERDAAEDGAEVSEPDFTVPDREPIDTRWLSGNVYEAICVIGHPVWASGWDLDPETLFLFFAGPFVDSGDSSSTTPSPYLYMSLASVESERRNTMLYVESLDEYLDDSRRAELARFRIPIVTALSDDPAELETLLGVPYAKRHFTDPERTRLIFARRLCFGGKLLAGLYVDVADGKLVRAKGVEDRERLARVISGEVLSDPDPEPLLYSENPPLRGSAQETFIEFLLLREAGDRAGALALLSEEQTNEWMREQLTRQHEAGVEIALDSLQYQTTKYDWGAVEISAVYYLENGTLVQTQNRLREEAGGWRLQY
ncbi:MAG: hypothetical protein MJE66_10920 [Proteobacteria bacterium]|nr:hypothetical protein [Pseudomonadota bacterium]